MSSVWYEQGLRDKLAGKRAYLPTDRGLSTFEKVVGSFIPGVNLLVAAEVLAEKPSLQDNRDYVQGFKDGKEISG